MATEFGVAAARDIDCEPAGDTAVGAVERSVDRPGVRTHRVARSPTECGGVTISDSPSSLGAMESFRRATTKAIAEMVSAGTT
jgi:hypothetical protein